MIMKSNFRYLLAGGLFLVMVGSIAWVTQFMPNWRTSREVKTGKEAPKSSLGVLKFPFTRAVWDKDDDEYVLEIEKGKEGHFDFPFENTLNQTAEIGLGRKDCDCTHMQVCFLPAEEWKRYSEEMMKSPRTAKVGDWNWLTVADSNAIGLEVPPLARGLVRFGWHARREPGIKLTLSLELWHQPQGNVGQRSFETLKVPSRIASPIRYTPNRANVGFCTSGHCLRQRCPASEFTLWSATRPDLDIKWEDAESPLFVYEVKPLSPEECQDMEKKLVKEGENTRVMKAFHFQVTVKEQAAGKQLDQGPFNHAVKFLLDDNKVVGPQITGTVRGDIVVGSADERGKMNLKTFRAKDGARGEVSLWTEDDKVVLESESQYPSTLDVKLSKEDKSGSRTKWRLWR